MADAELKATLRSARQRRAQRLQAALDLAAATTAQRLRPDARTCDLTARRGFHGIQRCDRRPFFSRSPAAAATRRMHDVDARDGASR